jgi:multidrug resistance efflux pump
LKLKHRASRRVIRDPRPPTVRLEAKAQLSQAQVNLRRTRILSPVDGYVTNLLAQLGDYVNVGVNTVSLVDADSFWGRRAVALTIT